MTKLSGRFELGRELVCDAADNLMRGRLRNTLALLGIAVGTAAVVAMLHLGYNARVEAMRQFEMLGVDLMMILPQAGKDGLTSLPFAMVNELTDSVSSLRTAAPYVLTGGTIRAGRQTLSANLVAVDEELYAVAGIRASQGRLTSGLDGYAAFAVVGAERAKAISQARGAPLLPGDRITVEGQVVTVIGILEEGVVNPLLGIEADRSVFIPFDTARRFMSDTRITNIAARIKPGVSDLEAADAVQDYFRNRLRSGGVHIQTARQLIEGRDRQMRLHGLLLLAIGAISLGVGSVGVINVLLMNVLERRQEIGLRLAVGARRRDIRMMFLVEAVTLSAAGCLIGTVLGFVAGWSFSVFSGWVFEPSPLAVPLGGSMALVVGLLSGGYPAHRAASLDPIVALRG